MCIKQATFVSEAFSISSLNPWPMANLCPQLNVCCGFHLGPLLFYCADWTCTISSVHRSSILEWKSQKHESSESPIWEDRSHRTEAERQKSSKGGETGVAMSGGRKTGTCYALMNYMDWLGIPHPNCLTERHTIQDRAKIFVTMLSKSQIIESTFKSRLIFVQWQYVCPSLKVFANIFEGHNSPW